MNEYKFLLQQGFDEVDEESAPSRFNALQFQPSIVGPVMLISIILQSPIMFLIVSLVLWINTVFPKANLIEAMYNALFAGKQGRPRITPAPMPRRFAQGMAATFMVIVAISLFQGWMIVAYLFEGLILIAFSLLLFGKFCLGAYIFHVLKGNASFANATCPWS